MVDGAALRRRIHPTMMSCPVSGEFAGPEVICPQFRLDRPWGVSQRCRTLTAHDTILACLLAIWTIFGGELRAVADVERPRIVLHCRDNASEAEQRVCEAMQQALGEKLPDHEFRRVTGPPAASASDESAIKTVHIMIDIEKAEEYFVQGSLGWWTSGKGAVTLHHNGPTVTTTIVDQPMTAQAYLGFARSLLKVTNLPFN